MVFDSVQRLQESDFPNWSQLEEPLISIDELEDGYGLMDSNNYNHYFEEYMREKGFTPSENREMHMRDNYLFKSGDGTDDVLDLTNGWNCMDDTSSIGFENDYFPNSVDDGNMATYKKMRKYRQELELQMMMLTKMAKKQEEMFFRYRENQKERHSQSKQTDQKNWRSDGTSNAPTRVTGNPHAPLYRSAGGPVLLTPIGEFGTAQDNAPIQDADMQEQWPEQPRRTAAAQSVQPQQPQHPVDEALKRQWCAKRKVGSYQKPNKNSTKTQPQVDYHRPPQPPKDDVYDPLPENLIVKVRNIHPTPSLHELHVQHPELFKQKPIFSSVQYGYTLQRRKRFAVLCQFEFNGATLYAQETAPTKSDAKLNAARAMIRKLNNTANVSISLKEESMMAAADTSLEHPRCRLLHLHDTRPDLYPQPPTFRASRCRARQATVGKSRCTNMICYFQVGSNKLTTVGAAHNKKQAIVQAARNMLLLLSLPENNDKNNQIKVEYTPPDRTRSPWTCHFCKIFMTGRRPFLSHLMGRCHIQRLSELGLNAEDENSVLRDVAEKAFEEKEELKRKTALKNNNLKRSQKARLRKTKLGRPGENKVEPSPILLSPIPSKSPSPGETSVERPSETVERREIPSRNQHPEAAPQTQYPGGRFPLPDSMSRHHYPKPLYA